MDSKFEVDHSLIAKLNQLTVFLANGNQPLRAPFVPDARAMPAAATDIKDMPGAYVFIIDMPGVESEEIKIDVEEGNMLVISGERKREEEEEERYLAMQRRMGKMMRKFKLLENANTDAISAVCKNGVLTVTVEKLPSKEPKAVEIKIA